MNTALKIHVTGIVQGVGFRPFIYRLAKRHLISGWVLNSADGVHIHAEGEENLVDEFCLAISNEAPVAARVEEIEMREVPLEGFETFEIKTSEDKKTSKAGDNAGQTLISPDLATCEDCVRELFDPQDRRYRYPFINCTNCGPRFTIIGKLPYDRCYTSMCTFKMCGTCESEYLDPADRRFHAQPDACFDCGPAVSWITAGKLKRSKCTDSQGAGVGTLGPLLIGTTREKSDEIFSNCVKFLRDGKIVVIKGLGGFHLACDATNEESVARLRSKKMRSNKAFAIMAPDLASVKKICHINAAEEKLLSGSARPIVLLQSSSQVLSSPDQDFVTNPLRNCHLFPGLAPNVTMGLPEIGVMLPYTPVQHILMHDYAAAGGKYLVMTSGNMYDNPIVTDDAQAFEILDEVADAFLGNNREILARYDDSVVRVIDAAGSGAIQMIRRARGYAPAPIKIKLDKPAEVFATGPEQKNTFAFSRPIPDSDENSKLNTEVFVSQHIGDIENADIFKTWEETKNQYEKIFKFKPNEVHHDLHPEYLTTKMGSEATLPGVLNKTPGSNASDPKGVQHHYAHIRSVMYENGMYGPVCGFAFDGTGFGIDKNIWGGECLICNTETFERFANFTYVPMPGGAAAIKDPLRMAYGALWTFDLLAHPQTKNVFKNFKKADLKNLNTMIEDGINTPMTSSVGRLFDAASAILGICPAPTYEGEAAIMLEAKLWDYLNENSRAKNSKFDNRYEIQITKNVGTEKSTAQDTSVVLLDCANTFKAILDDLKDKVEVGKIAKNFHDAFAKAILTCAQLSYQLYEINDVALSGGVFMNRYLIEKSIKLLVEQGFSVALNREVPPNDGGISLGQI